MLYFKLDYDRNRDTVAEIYSHPFSILKIMVIIPRN